MYTVIVLILIGLLSIVTTDRIKDKLYDYFVGDGKTKQNFWQKLFN